MGTLENPPELLSLNSEEKLVGVIQERSAKIESEGRGISRAGRNTIIEIIVP